jgi:hypothetical protein
MIMNHNEYYVKKRWLVHKENKDAKEEFNRKISLFTSKLNIEIRKKLIRYYVWSIALYGSETWTLRNLKRKYLEKCGAGGE